MTYKSNKEFKEENGKLKKQLQKQKIKNDYTSFSLVEEIRKNANLKTQRDDLKMRIDTQEEIIGLQKEIISIREKHNKIAIGIILSLGLIIIILGFLVFNS